MKNCLIKWGKKLAILVVSVFVISSFMTGCLEEDWEEESNEGWWEKPMEESRLINENWDEQHPQEEVEDDFSWWNALDESWTEDDWEYLEDGIYMIYDEETDCSYLYDTEYQDYAAMDMETEEIFLLDKETGEWIPAE